MAQYNTGNNAFQAANKTLFEVNQIATANGSLVSNTNPFSVTGTIVATEKPAICILLTTMQQIHIVVGLWTKLCVLLLVLKMVVLILQI